MVLPIGFFAPLPLAIMIPFMAAQSFAMGQAFGTSFQYGKRKISSMSNEEFNAVTANSLHEDIQADIRAMIPSMNQSFQRMEQFQIDIINSMVDTIKIGLDQLGQWIAGGFGINPEQTSSTSASLQGESGIFNVQGGDRNTETLLERQTRQEQDRIKREQLNSKKKTLLTTTTRLTKTGVKESIKAIDKVATGAVQQIATAFTKMRFAMGQIVQLNRQLAGKQFTTRKNSQDAQNLRLAQKEFLKWAKVYNALVQRNRKPHLAIDTAKSLVSKKLVLKK